MSVHEHIEQFAALQAELARPFVDRDAALARLAVDEASLRRAQGSWSIRLAAEDAGPLREAYASAFAGGIPPEIASDAGSEIVLLHETVDAPGPAPVRVVPSYLRAEEREAQVVERPEQAALGASSGASRRMDVDMTLEPVLSDEPTMPFAKAGPGVVPYVVADLRGAASADPAPVKAKAEETLWIASRPEPKAATPFQAAPPGPPSMPLEQYALFLALFGGHKTEAEANVLRTQFGIASGAAQQALGKHFAARFEADPNERRRFDAIVNQLRGGSR